MEPTALGGVPADKRQPGHRRQGYMKGATVMKELLSSYILPGFFGIMGLVTFVLYGVDKYKAVRHKWRIPEKVLLGFSLCGGFIGSWIGMFVFRHKIRHLKFYIVSVISTLLWLMLWGWLQM